MGKLYKPLLKRSLDIITALFGVIFALPFFIISIPFIAYSNKGHIFFTQMRSGLNGRSFRLIKLKTMNEKRDTNNKLLSDQERLTPVGRLMRSLSLDELPQMINVFRGDMSLVGPRPLLPEYLSLYNERQSLRHEVRPGITGWAQVNGRNSISWEEKFEMDIWYIDNISFKLDIKILFLTVIKVINREGINSENTVTMERFLGNKTALVRDEKIDKE